MPDFVRRSIATLTAVLLALLTLACSDEAQRDIQRAALEKVGDLATEQMANATGAHAHAGGDSGRDGKNHSRDFFNIPIEVRQLADNVYQARGVGNTQMIVTSEGLVIYDTGLSIQGGSGPS